MIYMDEEIHLIDLIPVETLKKIQDSFSKMARMAALTTDENGIPITEGSNFSDFCMNYCRKSPIGKIRCEKCDRDGALKVLESGNPVSYFCHANLVDFAAEYARVQSDLINELSLPYALLDDAGHFLRIT